MSTKPSRMKELFEGERAAKKDAGGQDAGDRDPAGDPRKKTGKPWTQAASGREPCGPGPVFDVCSVPILSTAPLHLCV